MSPPAPTRCRLRRSTSAAPGPDAFYIDDFLGDVRIDFESKTPGTAVFVGVGPAADVAAYLNGVGHDEVSDFDVDPFKLSTTTRAGDEPSAPAAQSFWVASATGTGASTLSWPATGGDWSVVIMNADGSRNVAVDLSVGGTVPAVEGITIGALIGAVVLPHRQRRPDRPSLHHPQTVAVIKPSSPRRRRSGVVATRDRARGGPAGAHGRHSSRSTRATAKGLPATPGAR